MAEEIFDYFDENYIRQGSAPKSVTRAQGLWVHSFHCWMIDSSAISPSILVQKRAKTKELFPDYLDISAAGHLAAGESADDGIREIREEVGLNVSTNDLVYLGVKLDVAKTNDIVNRQFCHVYLYPGAPPIDSLNLDEVELDGMVAVPVSDGLRLFSGEIASLDVQGVEKGDDQIWRQIERPFPLGILSPV